MDSDKGDNDFPPCRNLFSDFYARNTSKKIRAVMRAKGNAGEHLCANPPYGYQKDPADKKRIMDEEATEIAKRIFDVTALFFEDAMAFEEAARKPRFQEAEKEARKSRHEIAQAKKRIGKLDRIFKRIYEDDISGAIRHERFLKLSADYEAEQKELTEQINAWQETVETFEQNQVDFASFAAIVRKYAGIRKLTSTIVNEFIKKIIGQRRQKIELVWNFTGEVNLPGDNETVERQRKGRTA